MLKRIIYKQVDGDQEEVATWSSTDVLLKFVREAVEEASGLDASLFGDSADDILNFAEQHFPEIDGNGSGESTEAGEEQETEEAVGK